MAGLVIPPSHSFEQLPSASACGIYFLWSGGVVVYVGQSRWIGQRIAQHLADGRKTFDAISFLLFAAPQLNKVERRYIEWLIPKYNDCCLSKKLRRQGRQRGQSRPAATLGLTEEQFQWLIEQPGAPKRKKIRIPRANVRRGVWIHSMLADWAGHNPALLAEAKQR